MIIGEGSTMASFEAKRDGVYSPAAKALHWLVVALLFCQYSIAWTMPHIGRDTKPDRLIDLHFSFGVLILLVIVIRIAWRWSRGDPGPPAGLPPWAARSSRVIHYLLYLLLALLPLLGWMNASFRGLDVNPFGLVRLPQLIATRTPGFAWTGDVHALLSNYLLLPLAGLHIAAALYHRFIRKDRVLQRMLPTAWT
jgi:cytochrome b561